jgi:hypothetical protein
MINIIALVAAKVKGYSSEVTVPVEVVEVEVDPWNWEDHFCPDGPIADMCWYKGFYPHAPDLEGWSWCERGVNPRWLPNFLDCDHEPVDTRQGVSYPTSAFF